MFFTSVGYSQSNYRNNLLKWNRSDTVFQDVKYINLPSSLNWMLTYYDLYENECYNDSTNEIYHINDFVACYGWGDGCEYSGHWKYMYFHKQPTFEGFIKYLKQQ